MENLVDQIGNKSAGQLIKSDDWNALVAAMDGLSAQLTTLEENITTQITTLDDKITGLSDRVDGLDAEFDSFRKFKQEHRKLVLSTTQEKYVLGQLAVMTAQVTDLDGNPLDLSDPSSRPWVDFVATWGHLRPVRGFTSRLGEGDRTISIQTNADGIAKAYLAADHSGGFTTEEEEDIAAVLRTEVNVTSLNKTAPLADWILDLETPLTADNFNLFENFTAEYERTDSKRFSEYADTYYLQNAYTLSPNVTTSVYGHRWQDYQANIVAHVKADNDPTTPSHCQGAACLTVCFRDGFKPWIFIDYVNRNKYGPLVDEYRNRLGADIRGTYLETIERYQDQLFQYIDGDGILGKFRKYGIVEEALKGFDIPEKPDFWGPLVQDVESAIRFQQTVELTDYTRLGTTQNADIFNQVSNTNARINGAETINEEVIRGTVVEEVAVAVSPLADQLNGIQVAFDAQVVATNDRFALLEGTDAVLTDQVLAATTQAAEASTQVAGLETTYGNLIQDEVLPLINSAVLPIDERLETLTSTYELTTNEFNSQLATLTTTVNANEAGLTTLRNEFTGNLDVVTGDFTERVDAVAADVSTTQNDLVTLQNEVTGDLGFVTGKLEQMETTFLAEGGAFQVLQNNVTALETKVGAFNIEGLEPATIKGDLIKVSNHDDQLQDLYTRVVKLEGSGF